MNIIDCLQLYWSFFKVGLFTIGGGYAMIPLIIREVETYWPSVASSMQDLIGISQMTPGAFAINAATFVGMLTNGVAGAIFATLGVITPSLIITTVVAKIFYVVNEKRAVKDVFYGMRPVVVGLIVGTVLTMLPAQMLLPDGAGINMKAMFISILTLYVLLKLKVNPIITILISGVLGILIFGL